VQGLTVSNAADTNAPAPFSISSAGVTNGVIADAYGKRGKQLKNNIPTRSLPISITGAPRGTVCYALIMLDPDSNPLCGYEWVHWLAVNITGANLAENASIDNAGSMIQGKNDFGAIGYGGPTPPDKPHTYEITVYALDSMPDIQNGFSKEELIKDMGGHILAQAVLKARYGN